MHFLITLVQFLNVQSEYEILSFWNFNLVVESFWCEKSGSQIYSILGYYWFNCFKLEHFVTSNSWRLSISNFFLKILNRFSFKIIMNIIDFKFVVEHLVWAFKQLHQLLFLKASENANFFSSTLILTDSLNFSNVSVRNIAF